eukprot:gnl/TRDRNA2_/TRDRNA2_75247_c0_seq1.p1 gnl/TRDRNA2_/TRDRNA2_75247_c0~~gnl/TRDRNA2_/TRDRNA2_75247_c0_seq1.p1  ORF type:complete len:101 (+),score=6.27 gnl/TRDRNA2_/TRDRNA2_75247_c0_seq1:131-433(+)
MVPSHFPMYPFHAFSYLPVRMCVCARPGSVAAFFQGSKGRATVSQLLFWSMFEPLPGDLTDIKLLFIFKPLHLNTGHTASPNAASPAKAGDKVCVHENAA